MFSYLISYRFSDSDASGWARIFQERPTLIDSREKVLGLEQRLRSELNLEFVTIHSFQLLNQGPPNV